MSPLSGLTSLRKLTLVNNPIKTMPLALTILPLEMQWKNIFSGADGFITFYNNPLESPPPEIIAQGKEAVRSYLLAQQQAGQQLQALREVKVHLVGDGMVGKTSLLKQLQGLEFDPNESQTHGITVTSLKASALQGFPADGELQETIFHFWDFGGQEIMHASHQFFMSSRSLYILLLDSRTDSNKYYWLRHIEKYGGTSPLIVVMNKIDENPSYNIQQQAVNDKFPAIKNRFHRISCKKSEGIDGVVQSLAAALSDSGSLYGTLFSPAWLAVKVKLVEETAAKRYISRSRYNELCAEQSIDDQESRDTLLGYLNSLGIVLFFKELHFVDIYVLDPYWVTVGVYRIINSCKTSSGTFHLAELDNILNQEQIACDQYQPAKDHHFNYSHEEQRYLLDIMKQFELCYEEESGRMILPSNLPKEPETPLPNLDEGTPLRFEMHYDYLPSTIIPRLMIAMQADVADGLRWRYGMVLKSRNIPGVQASVIADAEQKRIRIVVQGQDGHRREYFTVLRHRLKEMNARFANLQVTEYIPLPGYPDELVKYQELLGYEQKGWPEYPSGTLGLKFPVSTLLDSVISKEEREKENLMIHIHNENRIENSGNSTVTVPVNQHVAQTNSQNVTVQQLELRQNIEELKGKFTNLKQEILDEAEVELVDNKEHIRLSKELDRVEEAIIEIEQAASEQQPRLSAAIKDRFDNFMTSVTDENSRLNKLLKLVSKGVERAQTVTDLYHKCSSLFESLPVP